MAPIERAFDRRLEDLLGHIFPKESHSKERLKDLWQELTDRKLLQEGPYPVTHGEKHVLKVMENMNTLLRLEDKKEWDKDEVVEEILVAAMIHDIGMYPISPEGAYGPVSEECRKDHASEQRLKEYMGKTEFFKRPDINEDYKNCVLLMAYAHTKDSPETDSSETLQEKTKKLEEYKGRYQSRSYVLQAGIALRLADFLDLGRDRLMSNADELDWRVPQKIHLLKHTFLSATLDPASREIRFENKFGEITDTFIKKYFPDVNDENLEQRELEARMEIFALYRSEFEKVGKHISDLQRYWPDTKIPYPTLAQLDDDLFGKIFPISKSGELFSYELQEALRELEPGEEFSIDIMGHSQFDRIVGNKEQINQKIQEKLSDSRIRIMFRILLLDPEVENQQMEEVYDAQRTKERESKRSILPSYDEDWKLKHNSKQKRGDILSSIHALEEEWIKGVPLRNTHLEVRLTRNIMYAAITRFGKRMIVSPYRGQGRFQASMAITLTPKAPLFEAYTHEFDSLWNSPDQTRLLILKCDPHAENPVKERLDKKKLRGDKALRPFEYELSMIDDAEKIDRVEAILQGTSDPIPPYEIEVQPSTCCTFSCEHCIGSQLSAMPKFHMHGKTNRVREPEQLFLSWRNKNDRELKFDSALKYEVKRNGRTYKIERVRISGLSGDPFEDGVKKFTFELIEKIKKRKRQVVIFTNGLILTESAMRKVLLELLGGDAGGATDDIHLSLDATREGTFKRIKKGKEFNLIKESAADLVKEAKKRGRNIRLTVGFVVTQMNAREIGLCGIRTAEDLGAGLVRFKPDIRLPRSVSYRAWGEACEQIQKQIKDGRSIRNGIRVVVNEFPLASTAAPILEQCWSQFFCTTLGPDGRIYPCDHITGRGGFAAMGSLYENRFDTIWKRNWQNLGVRTSSCHLCPPFSSRLNRFLGELATLKKFNDWSQVKKWLMGASNKYAQG